MILTLSTEAPSISPQVMVDQAEVDLPNIMLNPINLVSPTATPVIPRVVERAESFPLPSNNINMKAKKARKVANTLKKKRKITKKTTKKKKIMKRKKITLIIVIALISIVHPLNSTASQALARIVPAITPLPLMTPVLLHHKLPLQATSTPQAMMVSPLVELK